MNYEKLQNDEYRLFDFIKDKYERRRYAAKGKDPMALIYDGKEPEVVSPKKEENLNDSNDEEIVIQKSSKINFNKTKDAQSHTSNKFNSNTKDEKISQSTKGNNASLIDFMGVENVQAKEPLNKNLNSFNFFETKEKTTQNNQVDGAKQSGFSFINNNKNSSTNNVPEITGVSSLIDLQSYENQQSKQIKQLTENISNIYNSVNTPQQNHINNVSPNFGNFNQPNNNFYNMGYQIPQQSNIMMGRMMPNAMSNPYNNYGVNNMNMGYNQTMGLNGTGMNNQNLQMTKFNSTPLVQMPNNQTFNYDYYNNANNNSKGLYDLNFNGNSSLNMNSNNKKKDEDPFKNLVNLK
jgi:hypothetical protein